MATTTFAVRQFYNIPSEYGTFTAPSGVFVVTGSVSRLLVNNTRTNLANDSMSITTQNSSPYAATSASPQGWWPGASTDYLQEYGETMTGVIVGGNDNYANPAALGDGRTSTVSVWGFSTIYTGEPGADQTTLNDEFISLAGYILGTTYANTGSAKTALRNAGFYYQYPAGFDGQSPNTGNGSDNA